MNDRDFDVNNDERRMDYAQFDMPRRFRSEATGRVQPQSRMGRFFGGEAPNSVQRESGSQNFDAPRTGGAGGTVIYAPSTYEDVQLLIDHLKIREQVIVDFSNINQTSVYRILDFMSGAIYALGGSIKEITKNVFLFAPSGVTITVPPQLSKNK